MDRRAFLQTGSVAAIQPATAIEYLEPEVICGVASNHALLARIDWLSIPSALVGRLMERYEIGPCYLEILVAESKVLKAAGERLAN